MNKLPVGDTIRFAYVFTFGQIGTIIGLIWIPMVVNAVASFFMLGGTYAKLADAIEHDNLPMGPEMAMPFLFVFVAFFLFAVAAVAVVQQALGLRKGPAIAHFAVGSAEMRVYGGMFGLYLLAIVFVLGLALGLGVVAVLAGAALGGNAAAAGGIAGLAALAAICALVYAVIRLSYLFVPAAVAEGEFGLTRSWQLTAGNFWRIVVVLLATLLPLFFAVILAEGVLLRPELARAAPAGNDVASQMHALAAQMRDIEANLPVILGLSFVISPLLYGLGLGSASFAYRALSQKPARPAN